MLFTQSLEYHDRKVKARDARWASGLMIPTLPRRQSAAVSHSNLKFAAGVQQIVCICSVTCKAYWQGDWSSLEGRCHVTVRLQTLFNKRTMWKRRIADSVRVAGGAAMKDFMRLVRC